MGAGQAVVNEVRGWLIDQTLSPGEDLLSGKSHGGKAQLGLDCLTSILDCLCSLDGKYL